MFKGTIRINKDYFHDQNGADKIAELLEKQSFDEVIQELDGHFAMVLKSEKQIRFAVDHIRSFPLFYNNQIITDNPLGLSNLELDQEAQADFLSLGYCLGNKTLLKGLNQLRAGEIGRIKTDNSIEINRQYNYLRDQPIDLPNADIKEQIKHLLNRVFENWVSSLPKEPIGLTLSGGYDSRLIALMLKKFGKEDVICLTYGRQQNEELSNSARTAKKLGYRWEFITYDEHTSNGLLNDVEFLEYANFAGKASSMPFLQDYFGLKEAKKQQFLPQGSTIVFGHSGDFLGGSQLKGRFTAKSGKSDLRTVLETHYSLKKGYNPKSVIEAIIQDNYTNQFPAYSIYQDWLLQEHLSKFIVNSVSVAHFFGYKHSLPFYDKRLLDFFKNLPLHQLDFKVVFDEALREIFEEYGLNFDDELQPSAKEIRTQLFKDKVKKIVPHALVEKLKPQRPWHAYDLLTQPLLEDLKSKNATQGVTRNYNSIITRWYLEFLKK